MSKVLVFLEKKYKGVLLMTQNIFFSLTANITSIILFEMIYKILTFFLIVPLNVVIINAAVNLLDTNYLANLDFLRLLNSVPTVLGVLCISIISFIWIYIELYIVTSLIHQSKNDIDISFKIAFQNCFKSFKNLLTIRVIPLMLLLCLIGPFVGVGLYNSLIKDIQIPYFMMENLYSREYGQLLFILFVIVVLILFLRWILILPKVVINDTSLKNSFKEVRLEFKNKYTFIISALLFWAISHYIYMEVSTFIYIHTGGMFLTILPDFMLSYVTLGYLIVFILLHTMTLIFLVPLFSAFLLEINNHISKNARVYPHVKISVEKLSIFKKCFIVAVFLIFGSVIFNKSYYIISFQKLTTDIKVTAHRGGGYGAPENTLEGMVYGIEQGGSILEVDVMLTSDNVPVLFHDDNLNKIDGTKRTIATMTLEEVKTVDAGSWFNQQYAGITIPTLEEALLLIDEYDDVILNIELKLVNDNWLELSKYVDEVIADLQMGSKVMISSLSYRAVSHYKQMNPTIKVGHIVSLALGNVTYEEFDFVCLEFSLLNKDIVEKFKLAGKEIHVWTVNSAQEMNMCITYQVDSIITDQMDTAYNLIEKAKLDVEHNKDLLAEGINRILKYYKF